MSKKDIIKTTSALVKILFAITTIYLVGINGFLYTQAYFSLNVAGVSLPSRSGWWVSPDATLISPNGGESLFQNNNYLIRWSAVPDPSATIADISLFYSVNAGAFNLISGGEANDGIYNWTVPGGVFSSNVVVRVVATDNHGLVGSDVSNTSFIIKSPIVINEFLPNPVGDDALGKPNGEWVELRNNGSVQVDVAGWYVYDQDPSNIVISPVNSDNNANPLDGGETTVPAGGYLVVYRNGDSDFELNNSGGDSVRLYNAGRGRRGDLIDSYAYTSVAPENKSYARIPDGFGAFVDPVPTPGEPNKLEENNPPHAEAPVSGEAEPQVPALIIIPTIELEQIIESSPALFLDLTVEPFASPVPESTPMPLVSPTPDNVLLAPTTSTPAPALVPDTEPASEPVDVLPPDEGEKTNV